MFRECFESLLKRRFNRELEMYLHLIRYPSSCLGINIHVYANSQEDFTPKTRQTQKVLLWITPKTITPAHSLGCTLLRLLWHCTLNNIFPLGRHEGRGKYQGGGERRPVPPSPTHTLQSEKEKPRAVRGFLYRLSPTSHPASRSRASRA